MSKATDWQPQDRKHAIINTESFWETESSHVIFVSHSLAEALLILDSTVRIDLLAQIPQKGRVRF